jgi:hypothetical protein
MGASPSYPDYVNSVDGFKAFLNDEVTATGSPVPGLVSQKYIPICNSTVARNNWNKRQFNKIAFYPGYPCDPL